MEIQTPTWYDEVYTYELHLTVKANAVEHFKDFCKVLKVKPLLIEMQLKDGHTSEDLMCSFKQETTYEHIVDKAQSLAKSFRHFGFNVVRTKIETVPWHPAAPQGTFDDNGKRYLEAHIGVLIPKPSHALYQLRSEELENWCKLFGVRKSKNLFKEDENSSIQMYTIREYKSAFDFDIIRANFLTKVKLCGFEVERSVSEFAIYDSNVSHDADWIG